MAETCRTPPPFRDGGSEGQMSRPALRDKHLLLLSCLLFLTASGLALSFLLEDARESIVGLHHELDGADGLRPLREVRELLPRFFKAMETQRTGDAAANRELVRHREEIDHALARLDQLDRAARLGVTEPLFQVQQRWAELKRDTGNEPAHRNDLEEALGRLNTQVGDESGLILDPKIDTYYLVNVVLNKLVDNDDLVIRSRSLLMASSPAGMEARIELANLATQLGTDLKEVDYSFEAGLADHPGLNEQVKPILRSYRLRTQELIQLLTARSRGEAGPQMPEPVLDAARVSSFRLFDATLPVLQKLLEERLETEETIRGQRLILLTSLLSAAIGLAAWGLLRGRKATSEALPAGPRLLAESSQNGSPREAAVWEERELKLLIAELTLENRALRQTSEPWSAQADSQAS
jgi:hypothetical protein